METTKIIPILSHRQNIMGNTHHRVNMALFTFLVMAISAHECLTSQENQMASSSELNQLKISSHDKKDNSGITGKNTTESSGIEEAHSAWPAVLGALTVVISTGILIALAVRYRFFRWCRARSNHALLEQGETASQFSHDGSLEGEMPVRGMRGRMIHTGGGSDDEDDDDGFIEDNYIPGSVRRKAEEEEQQLEEAEDSDDELVIPE